MSSIKDIVDMLKNNESSYKKLDIKSVGVEPNDSQWTDIMEALGSNTVVTTIVADNTGMNDAACILLAKVLETNTTITNCDIGYNKINGPGISALGAALTINSTVTECKIHRQEKDCGPKVEAELVKLWDKNTTLSRLYATLHDRTCNGTNTKGETRNKTITKRKSEGKDWMDLDPNRKEEYAKLQAEQRAKEQEELAAANAPISEKVASTGGPYTYKQLTCDEQFRPDDVDLSNRETFLNDAEFQELFKMTKEEFSTLAGWKKSGKKKEHKLH